MKTFLHRQGFYEAPDWGITEIPDRALFAAIKAFQKAQGLRVDGVMKPKGETEEASQLIQAQKIQNLGRNGDTILAHITPKEAKLLKAQGGSGTINPKTGLLEFFESDEEEGQYIWRTEGDSKVRSSHAERNGKTFSWDNPPDGGHPGEALNCRCEAENIAEKDTKCGKIKVLMEESWDRHDALQKPILDAKNDIEISENILKDLREEHSAIKFEMVRAALPSSKKIGRAGLAITAHELQRLQKRLEKIEISIEIEERTLTQYKEKLEQLEHDRKNEREYAEELSRRFNACTAKRGKPRA